uniref:Uncharacterized protein n=1 Tax=Anguilla anguilla TaxID=7936 RepID=A0A0E9P849_ANGAN
MTFTPTGLSQLLCLQFMLFSRVSVEILEYNNYVTSVCLYVLCMYLHQDCYQPHIEVGITKLG